MDIGDDIGDSGATGNLSYQEFDSAVREVIDKTGSLVRQIDGIRARTEIAVFEYVRKGAYSRGLLYGLISISMSMSSLSFYLLEYAGASQMSSIGSACFAAASALSARKVRSIGASIESRR